MRCKADELLDEIAAGRHGIFTIEDARDVGLTHGQIDRRSNDAWSRIYDGVFRVRGAPITWRGDLRAAVCAAGAGAAISHRAAAALYGLPGGRDDLVGLTCRRWERSTRPGIVVHESRRFDQRDVRVVDGIPVTCPERTLLDLASRMVSTNFLEMVADPAFEHDDSKQEHSDEFQLEHDARRRNALQAAGYSVLSARHADSRAGGGEICAQISKIMRRNS